MSELLEAKQKLLGDLSAARPPRIVGGLAEPGELEELAAHLVDVARIFDAYVLAIGEHASENTRGKISLLPFTDQMVSAIAGNATFVLDRAAETIRDDYRPQRRRYR